MAEKIISEKTYLATFIGLLVLTLSTYEAAKLDLGRWNFPVALAIAAVKAALVVVYFMQVRFSNALTRVVIGVGIFWLGILFALTMNDYVTRAW